MAQNRALAEAANAQRAGQFEHAESLCFGIVESDPACLPALFMLGVLSARKGDAAQARVFLERVLEAEPTFFEALVSLGTLRMESGDIEDAASLALRAVRERPSDPQAQNLVGRCHLLQRRLPEAAEAFKRALGSQPNFAPSYFNLARVYQLEGKDGEATKAYGAAARLAPTLANLLGFGQALLAVFDYANAEACARRCLEMAPDSAGAHLLMCGVLLELKDLEGAEKHLQKAVDLDIDGAEALQLATRQKPLGHMEEANENLRRAIQKEPRLIPAYDSLMHNQRVTERDRPLVNQMRTLLNDRSLSPTELAQLHFGLGKGLEDLGEFEESMHHYDEANRVTRVLKFGDVKFDEARYEKHITSLIDCYDRLAAVAADTGNRSTSDLPIVIVGMMRSGTTLAEQILSSHPDVGGAGEQLFWSARLREMPDGDISALYKLGRDYVEHLRSICPGTAKVTDKLPGNAHFAGLIHLASPNARIIHMKRSPIDTCLSIWATPNNVPNEGGNDKAAIVFVYRQYLRLVAKWRQVLPPDRFLEVEYESLVSDPEPTTRRMVEFCGLEWDEACLYPEKNRRLVSTPSVWQVRQPVYKTSVERWRKFEPWLGEFKGLNA